MKQKTLLKNSLFALILSFTMLSFSVFSHAVEKAEEKTSQPVWIDVRTTAENLIDGIEGDTHIPYDEIVPEVSKLFPDKNTEIHVYCKSGGRAQKALQALQDAGYSHVKNMGGIADVKKLREIKD